MSEQEQEGTQRLPKAKAIHAKSNYVLVDPIPLPKRIIDVPDTSAMPRQWAKAISVGEGAYDANGTLCPPDIKPGDTVFHFAHAPAEADLKACPVEGLGEVVRFVSELDVIALYEEDHVKPLGGYLEIEVLEREDEQVSPAGLIIPGKAIVTRQLARVKTLGTGLRTPFGQRLPFHIEVGDRIVVRNHAYFECPLGSITGDPDEKTYLIAHGDILGVVEEADQEESDNEPAPGQ